MIIREGGVGYTQLFDRWVVLTTLSEDDRKALVGRIHEEVTSGVQALAGLALAEVKRQLEDTRYGNVEAYANTMAPVPSHETLLGYLPAMADRGFRSYLH